MPYAEIQSLLTRVDTTLALMDSSEIIRSTRVHGAVPFDFCIGSKIVGIGSKIVGVVCGIFESIPDKDVEREDFAFVTHYLPSNLNSMPLSIARDYEPRLCLAPFHQSRWAMAVLCHLSQALSFNRKMKA